jgi:hypothetical protein
MTTLPHLETSDIPRPGGATMDYDGSAGLSEGPERDLLFAVLNDAVQILLGAVRTPSLPRDSGDIGRRYKEVVRWMESCDTDYVFSFECVCESLGMNPAHIRAGFKKKGGPTIEERLCH